MQLTKYKLGDLIVQRREKNKNFDVPIRGVSKEGFIKPKQQEADTSIYNVFYRNDFVFNPARMELNSIALNLEFDKALCSSLYEVFYVKDESIVLPEYLNLHIKREEFARYCDYIGLGSAREYCRFANISGYEIELPPIDKQQEIVEADRLIKRRINLNEQMIQNLEATAQALYRKTFVDNIDKENLPEGWKMGTIGEFCKEMKSGGTPSRNHNEYWDKNDFLWLKSGEVHNNIIITVEEYISQAGLNNSSAKIIPHGSVIMAMYGATAAQVAYLNCDTTTNQACCNMICNCKEDAAYLFFHLLANQEDIKKLANGGAQENLSQELIAQQPIVLLNDNEKILKFVPILDNLVVLYKENEKLTELQSLLLAKMGTI